MYYLVYIPLYLLSLLPLRVLYILSDIVYGLFYYVIGYRRKVVMKNLEIAFPDKTIEERKAITKQFYKNFVDNFIETIKLFSASPAWIKKHFDFDPTILNDLYRKGVRAQLHLGHNFNWEMANLSVPLYTDFPFLVVYMPIKNKAFNNIFQKMRSRMGTILLPATDMKNAMLPYREKQYLLTLVADQAPGSAERAYWLNFMGRPTDFLRGPERGARAGKLAVVFGKLYKTRRGYYKAEIELATENAAELPEGELTRTYVRFLEKFLHEHPDMWLWSHRRWKHEWREEYKNNWIGE
ncbi:MAG: lysophospholipid acyltransferase family protein [Chitinophagaceae bacterium]